MTDTRVGSGVTQIVFDIVLYGLASHVPLPCFQRPAGFIFRVTRNYYLTYSARTLVKNLDLTLINDNMIIPQMHFI
jgi:hypothetical protein